MTINFRKTMLIFSTTLLMMQVFSMPIGMVYAETTMDTESSDRTLTEETLSKNILEQEEISEYYSTENNQETISEESRDSDKEKEESTDTPVVKQKISSNGKASLKDSIESLSSIDFEQMKHEDHRPEISFVIDTFKAEVNQSINLILLLKSNRSEFGIRIPSEARVDWQNLSQGIVVTHQEGEYWHVQLDFSTDVIKIPIIFNSTGAFFLSVDHDDSHIYVEVCLPSEERKKAVNAVVDANISVPREVEEKEQARILETTLDENNRSQSNVSNWSQFRSAWNSSSVTTIAFHQLNATISAGSASLNTRNTSVSLSGMYTTIHMGNTGHSLNVTGVNTILRTTYITITSNNSGSSPLITAIGSTLNLNLASLVQGNRNSAAVVVNSGGHLALNSDSHIYNSQPISPLVLNNGHVTLNSNVRIGSNAASQNYIPPISSSANSTININARNVVMMGRVSITNINQFTNLSTFAESWNSVNVQLTGENGSIVQNDISDPADFSKRYLENFNTASYRSIVTGAGSGEWVIPPVLSYNLLLEASPTEGGNPTTEVNNIQQGSTTTISANPNEGYLFVHWEIISGTGANIASLTSETTTFTMGNEDAIVKAIYEEAQEGEIHVYHTDKNGHELTDPVVITGSVGEAYSTEPVEIKNYQLLEKPDNATGLFTDETISVVYIYDIKNVSPVDPLDPEIEVDPENKPELPEDQGLLSIDFASSFNFGTQSISLQEQTYYAQPQRLLNEDGTVNEEEERPNYVQISDRRPENERNGWELAVTQKEQFKGEENQELVGARLSLLNQQLVTVQGGTAPGLQTVPSSLVPGNRRTLLKAQGNEGTGTWIYRFGDEDSAGESVALNVPKGANPEATTYSTTLIWELSAVPGN
ncbi:WxL domain-containing protein [Enterococcus sp. DIV0840c]|uniref:WxL domain-containing protein n=1 Tax=Enterococcus sp. DIV0840c TaxID=2774772 RepID=UPI003D2857D7